MCALLWVFAVASGTAHAATCAPAATRGAAPDGWQSYCWLDLSSYNDTTARSAAGQAFTIDLSDGSKITFTLKTVSSAATGGTARAAPSWTGAAIGNSSFINIPGKPIIYMDNTASTVTFTFSNIRVTPPPGVASITNFAFVAADAESTDNNEYLEFTTNGSAWKIIDTVPPTSGSQYPVLTGVDTATLRESGGGKTGSVGAYIAASNKPTTVTAKMQGQGLQGMMFAVRFASIQISKQIYGARVDATDQFNFSIRSTSSGQVLASGTTSGTGNGPFPAAVISTASGIPVTLTESIANGSASAMTRYRPRLTCTNDNAGSPTVMPSNAETTNYDFGSLAFGDAVSCIFTNASYPHVARVTKKLGSGGRIYNSDQFTLQVTNGSAVIASTTTTGSGTTVTNGNLGPAQLEAGQTYQLREKEAGTTVLSRYTPALSCSNAFAGSTTPLPTSLDSNFSMQIGDVITCILTNTRSAANAILQISKVSELISDPVNGTDNPKFMPGAKLRYRITVTNMGDLPVDASTISIVDPFPVGIAYNAASPVQFVNGTTPSGLNAFNPSTMVGYSNQVGGGAPYTYAPNTSGYDTAVRGIRIRPTGTMTASNGTSNPSFSVTFEARVE